MKKFSIIIVVIIASLMVLGSAYSDWNQVMNVRSTTMTGNLLGSITYRTNEEKIILNEKSFHDYYKVEVTRSNITSTQVNDVIIFRNQGSVLGKFQGFKTIDINLSADVNIKTQINYGALNEDGSPTEPVYDDGTTTTINLPSNLLEFNINNKESLDIYELCDELNRMNDRVLTPGRENVINIKESLVNQDRLRDSVISNIDLKKEEIVHIIGYNWNYSYKCELKTQ